MQKLLEQIQEATKEAVPQAQKQSQLVLAFEEILHTMRDLMFHANVFKKDDRAVQKKDHFSKGRHVRVPEFWTLKFSDVGSSENGRIWPETAVRPKTC